MGEAVDVVEELLGAGGAYVVYEEVGVCGAGHLGESLRVVEEPGELFFEFGEIAEVHAVLFVTEVVGDEDGRTFCEGDGAEGGIS